MKALTLTQPWASLVALGEKRIETRSWETLYRGPLAIHAAKGFPGWAKRLCCQAPFSGALYSHRLSPDTLPLGRVLCVTSVLDCQRICEGWKSPVDVPPFEGEFGDYTPGRFAWVLGTVEKAFDPGICAVGRLGLWTWMEGRYEKNQTVA